MSAVQSASPIYSFYESQITWHPFEGLEHLEFALLDVDEERDVVDLIVKFEPNENVAVHNHFAQTNMFIIQGELRIYETDGTVKEARPAGRYYRGKRDDIHSEGGGPDGAVVFYSIRGHGSDHYFQILDDDHNVVGAMGMAEVKEVWKAQNG